MALAFNTTKNTISALVFGSDHAGFSLKNTLVNYAKLNCCPRVEDVGATNSDSVDYPDFASKLAKFIKANPECFGVLICGSGIGISIAANRFPHIRAALCRTVEDAQLARAHNDANVLVLGARVTDEETAKQILNVFVNTNFDGGRHQNRVDKLGEKYD